MLVHRAAPNHYQICLSVPGCLAHYLGNIATADKYLSVCAKFFLQLGQLTLCAIDQFLFHIRKDIGSPRAVVLDSWGGVSECQPSAEFVCHVVRAADCLRAMRAQINCAKNIVN